MSLPTRVLAGMIAVLALVLALEWLLPDAAPPTFTPAARLHAQSPRADAPTRDTSEWVEAVLARPVFSISRRPPRVAASGRSDAAVGEARLAGIMITPAGRRAIFAPSGGGRSLVLAEGAVVNQSTIRGIYPDRVVLAGGAVLHPSFDPNRSSQTTPIFQPIQPNFQPIQPGFAAPGFANPNQPGFVPPGFPPPGMQVPQPGTDDGVPQLAVPQAPPQAFRPNMIPQRRE